MFRLGENLDESAEHEAESVLRLARLEFRDRWLVSNNERQFGDEVGQEPSVRPQCPLKCTTPDRQLGFALSKKRPHETLKGLHQGRIRNVTLVLIELAGAKEATVWI